jgi:hypothetical protein
MSGIPAGMNPIAIGNGGTNATTAPQALLVNCVKELAARFAALEATRQ